MLRVDVVLTMVDCSLKCGAKALALSWSSSLLSPTYYWPTASEMGICCSKALIKLNGGSFLSVFGFRGRGLGTL